MEYVTSVVKNVFSNKNVVRRLMFALQKKIWKRNYRVSIKSGYMGKNTQSLGPSLSSTN